jgi:quercetin dioxygenase-like cupin family protein
VRIIRGRESDTPSQKRSDTFTGGVWGDNVLKATDGALVNNVFFEPRARTHWHRHERGQVLLVTAGCGYVQVRDGEGTWVGAGDVVHFAPGEEHWHGAGPESYLLHTAVSLGTTEWLEAVSPADYERSVGA